MSKLAKAFTDPYLLVLMSKLKKQIELIYRSRPDEAAVREDLATYLDSQGYKVQRDHPLTEHDIPDFLIEIGGYTIVLQIKLRARRTRIQEQLRRYAQHEAVDAILLLSETMQRLPTKLEQKPALLLTVGERSI